MKVEEIKGSYKSGFFIHLQRDPLTVISVTGTPNLAIPTHIPLLPLYSYELFEAYADLDAR